jgi:hypothetical protein
MTLRLHVLSFAVALVAAGCNCNNFAPVDDCNGVPCPDGGGGGTATGGGEAGGEAGGMAGGDAGGMAGGEAGGMAGGGDAGGAAGGGDAGGMAAGGDAGGMAAGGDAGGMAAGGAAGGMAAGGMAAGGAAGGTTSADGGVYDFCGEIAQRECDFYIRCVASGSVVGDPVTGRANNTVPMMQRTQCEAERRTECRVRQAGEARRRATNLTALRACLDAAFPSASCARDRNAELTLCDEAAFTTPLGQPGAICTSDLECARGFCQASGGNSACGSCRAWVNPDGGTAACSDDVQCATGTFCRQAIGQDVCVPLVGVDGGCASTAQCAPGLVCPSGTGGIRSCQVGKPEGAACTRGRFECFRSSPNDFDLLCATVPGATDGGDRCVRRFNTAPGGFCNNSEGGGNTGVPQGPTCLDSEYCNAGLCEARRAAGQPCAAGTDVCAVGTRCFNNVCTPYGDVGAPCASSDACKALLYCAGATPGSMGTCQPFISFQAGMCGGFAGGMQTEVFPFCRNGSYCPTAGGMQVCQAQKPNGQACASAVECLGGSCNGMCVNACWN